MQFIKYYFFGAFVNASSYLLFIVCINAGYGHKFIATILYIIGSLVSFWFNRNIVFESDATLRNSLIKLIIMLISGYVLNISILFFCVDKIGLDSKVVMLFSVVLVSLYFYGFNKYFVHKYKNL